MTSRTTLDDPTPGARRAFVALNVYSFLAIGLACLHLALPTVWNRLGALQGMVDSIRWALLALNTYWSLLIVLTAVLSLVIARHRSWKHASGRWTLAALAAYWLLHAAYLLARPFPFPENFAALSAAFLALPLLEAALLITPVVIGLRSSGPGGYESAPRRPGSRRA